MATKPFLVIDLEKARPWREELHPRDKFGRFTSVRGGSRVVTSTGKTGVVKKNSGNKVTVQYDGGGSATLLRDNILHEIDYAKVKESKKKTAKAKKAGKKASATKAQTKANGTKKATAVKDPTKTKAKASTTTAKTKRTTKKTTDPITAIANQQKKKASTKTTAKTTNIRKGSQIVTSDGIKGKVDGQTKDGKSWLITTEAGKKIKRVKSKVTHANDVKATNEKTTAKASTKKITAKKTAPKKQKEKFITNYGEHEPVTVAIPKGDNKNNVTQNKEVADYVNAHKDKQASQLDKDFERLAGKLMAKPANKRSDKQIKEIAGKITEANKKLAFNVANKRADMMGWGVIQNRIGNVNAKNPIYQETGGRFELIQSAMGAMYETLHRVLDGSENPKSSIGAHVVNRMKQKVTKDLYGMLNTIPAPHEVRRAIGEMKKAEQSLTQELGRTPTDKEIGEYLMKTSEAFQKAPIVKPARWDEKKNTWVATNKQETDPEARYKALKRYADQQRTASLNAQVGGGQSDDRATEVADTLAIQDDSLTPEEVYERKERQKELEGAIPSALKEMQLTPLQIELYTLKHSEPSATRNQPFRTDAEVAELYNKRNGTNYSGKWVYKHVNEGRKLIAEAVKNNHPAVQKLLTMKSFVFTMILKSIFEYDLVKSLHKWGLDHTALDMTYTRTVYGLDLQEVRKSLAPTEYIGSYVTADSGHVRAHIVEYSVPEPTELAKSFYEFSNEIRKSMFPHKGGTNHAVNQKATDYVKANKGKYKKLHSTQQERIKAKQAGGGKLTWSEQLALDKKGFWISWGGKKILIVGDEKGFGEVAYDSKNEAHREEYNQGAQEDRLEFHHEDENLKEHRKKLEEKAKEDHKKGEYKASGRTNKKKWAEHHGVKWNEETGDFHTDEEGNLVFDHSHNEERHRAQLDHGIQAFNEEMEKLKKRYHGKGGLKDELRSNHGHKATAHYTEMSEEERAEYDKLDDTGKAIATGKHLLEKEGVTERLKQLQEELRSADPSQHKEIALNALDDLKKLSHGSKMLVNKNLVTGKGKGLGGLAKELLDSDFDSEDGLNAIAQRIGSGELSRSREEVGKNLIPAGKYVVGNPETGQTIVISVEHSFEGGRGGKGGQFASVVKEAFDPATGEHYTFEGAQNSWGMVANKLGFKRNMKFAEMANKDTHSPLLQELSEEDFQAQRKKTQAGLRDEMLHKEFKKVNEARDKDGNITSQTYAMDMPDGTQNVFEVNNGYISDPIMRRLLNQRTPIENEEDLHDILQNAVGKTTWVTLHVGSDIHAGDALGHHVKLMYDGKGAPIVVGGTYNGYRFVDSADVPKGATDPHTGEPVKALFKNGKLVDRRFTTKNDVPMEKGKPVMYPVGNGKFKKGRINDIQDGKFKVTDGKGNLIGMFDKKELKHAREDGKINADSGNAVVKLAKRGTHRMDTSEVFKPASDGKRDVARAEKAQNLLAEALKKAKVNNAFEDGNLKKNLELSDPQMNRLKKVLGRSKAGREMLKNFNSAYTEELQIHVPNSLKPVLEAEGVTVRKDGTAYISTGKFEQLRDVLNNAGSGLSLEQHARTYLNDHFRMKDRTKQSIEELKKKYQPSALDSGKPVLDEAYKNLFKEDSFLRNPNAGLFSTQLEGIGHLVERRRAIAGHGINSTLAMTFMLQCA